MELKPRLYILMRTDMASMTRGKACAQAAHAANQAVSAIKTFGLNKFRTALKKWEKLGYAFGTTIVLDAGNEKNLGLIMSEADTSTFTQTGLLLDDGYPIRDGEVTHKISVYTCGWIFTLNHEKYRPNLELLN